MRHVRPPQEQDGPLKLTCSDEQLAGLVQALDRAGKRSKVQVDSEALEALIVDHTRALRIVGYQVPNLKRVKLPQGRVRL